MILLLSASAATPIETLREQWTAFQPLALVDYRRDLLSEREALLKLRRLAAGPFATPEEELEALVIVAQAHDEFLRDLQQARAPADVTPEAKKQWQRELLDHQMAEHFEAKDAWQKAAAKAVEAHLEGTEPGKRATAQHPDPG